MTWKLRCSQTTRKQTPLGPSIAVRLREVSAYERLKSRKHHRGVGYGSHASYPCFRLVHVKFLSINAQNL